jgi:poly-gamma-glutamate synthesis protein (capsule biosynthesis protein)
MKALKERGIDFVGAIPYDQISAAKDPFDIKPYIVKRVNNINIAFFAFTRFVNPHFYRLIPSDKYNQVYKFTKKIIGLSNMPKIIKWINHAKENGADLVAISAHWGMEYTNSTDFIQRKLAKELFEGGADIIFGGHPHVLQRMEKYVAKDNRENFVIYSLGNFASGFRSFKSRAAIILYITIVKNEKGIFIKNVKYLPVFTSMKKKKRRIEDIQVIPVDHDSRLLKYYEKILGSKGLTKSSNFIF